jgi:molecular chaperone GrpE
MSDPATPTRAGEVDGSGVRHAALTPDRIDAVLADFRGYLTELLTPPPPANNDEPPPVDLSSVVAQLTALRHEVNLQTKASRAAVEQTAEAMKLSTPKPAADADEIVKPLVKALVDIADALTIGLRQAEKVRDGLAPLLDDLATASAISPRPPGDGPLLPISHRSLWDRMFGRWPPGHDPNLQQLAARIDELNRQQWGRVSTATAVARQTVGNLADGYAMSLRRVERVLPQFGLEPIECVGQPFDPELMEVVEAVDGHGRPGGTVVEEVRRGYRWHGKPYRFAQVKVAR